MAQAQHFKVLTSEKADEATRGVRQTTAMPGNGRFSPANGAHDEIAKLVQRLFVLPGPAKTPGALAFCGVERGAGCSWICARCGEALAAQVTGSVCIVDANLRQPSLHRYFQFEIENGLADAMQDSRPLASLARQIGADNLWLITAGSLANEPTGALNPARLRARFSELRSKFDYLLIDTPAMASFSDAILLAQVADGAVLVVGSHSTRREAARAAKDNFDASGVPVLGVVLNKRTYPIPEALYRRL